MFSCIGCAKPEINVAAISDASVQEDGQLLISGSIFRPSSDEKSCVELSQIGVNFLDEETGFGVFSDEEEFPEYSDVDDGSFLPKLKSVDVSLISPVNFEISIEPWVGAYLENLDGEYAGVYTVGAPLSVQAELLFFDCRLETLQAAINGHVVESFKTDFVRVSGDKKSFFIN